MTLTNRQLLHHLCRMPFVDVMELAEILGESLSTVHRAMAGLVANGIITHVNHGTVHLPSSRRYYLTTEGIAEATGALGFRTPSDFVRSYPLSREWLALLIRRMDAVASIYRVAASISPGIDGHPTGVDFHRRGRFDATITLHDGRSFGVVRQGLALRRRSLFDRLRAISGYGYRQRPNAVLILTPSSWEQGLTSRFCINRNMEDCYIAVESRSALERRNLRVWCHPTFVFGNSYHSLEALGSHGSPGGGPRTQSPSRKRASIPNSELMVRGAATFGIRPSEKRVLDLVTDHPMIPREHLAHWLDASEVRVSQMMRSLVDRWGLVERWGKRGDTRYTLSDEGIRYVTNRDRAQLPTTRGTWSTALTTDRQGRSRHVGHRIDTWARQTKHSDGITWFLSTLEDEARADPANSLLWSVPTARSDRAFNWGESAIAPDAVGKLIAGRLHIPFYFEYELRARHPQGVMARLRPYVLYYWSTAPKEDQPPFPTTLFVVDRKDVESTFVRTAARMTMMSLPILVSCPSVLAKSGILGRSWRPLWAPESPRLALSDLGDYGWDSLYHRMRPIGGKDRAGAALSSR